MIPVEQCQKIVPLMPTACRRCGTTLWGVLPQPWRHPVWELPEIQPIVTESQRHCLACPRFGETTCGELPPGVPHSQAGPPGRLVCMATRERFRQAFTLCARKSQKYLTRTQVVGRGCPRARSASSRSPRSCPIFPGRAGARAAWGSWKPAGPVRADPGCWPASAEIRCRPKWLAG